MGRKEKVTVDRKIAAVKDYLIGKKSCMQICFELEITKGSFRQWVRKYQLNGELGLQCYKKNTYYPESLKLQAVSDYERGAGSLNNLCNKYNISSHGILQRWIKKYNDHNRVKSHNSKGDSTMIIGRKTNYEERIEIVSFCIKNNDNYQLASEKFNVSYQQVYAWTSKYKEGGVEALVDRRGKRKSLEQLTETEKLAAQIKLLEAENKRLEIENSFLKKLDEVERRRDGKTNT
ncbi:MULTISPECIES: helix-turn-helix domain-containing protein [Clostridium]|uniref:Transposase n=2 Tax=Clostridium TaxID=1485 RepID=D8GIQ6_CLOLD|nr:MULTISPECIES: helix-turn-helix domain-containing protein [Clostridium]ADK14981.1 conserved hypothetical protein [Clostridium ljungdahlii DSM 13528]AGY78255.1 transposase [Clostridium autoethanogenum DSM 10061]ALU38387.1 putative transposase [Clostridium autoethanogenum DSM 10061]OAA87641.1 Transposase [Clostridium ljungdahlii DSM 13528]OVY51143.1 Transposase [Clostridium autoethanogenum]